ncbi:MAG: sodium:proton antiporter [Rhodobiaceae bacterium]|jgi:multicomponent Na+:H+ antiporter subunit G|nr:sodium:proton antiporter [Rhodobiaceae bacterium]|tara:strand:+ start:212 stop:517 length:306 start_codon:yes stop_codon:yes gene_type:complete
MDIINLVSSLFITIGALSIIVGLLGVYRMPDFYTRLHAASIIDTLGTMLILFGLILYYGLNIVSLKLLLILIFILITTPTAAHALAKSALHGNLKPILKDD